ncbi:MAG: hypothetical protein ACRCYQ_00195 [Nocardioides sp.]
MSDHMSTLLKNHLADVEVPQPDLAATLRNVRHQRARHRVRRGVAAAAVVGMAAAGAATLPDLSRPGDPRFAAAAATAAYRAGGAFALGSTLYFGNSQEYAVEMGRPIRSINYVEAGVVVGTGKDKWWDGDGPSTFSLVTTAGKITALDIEDQRSVSTDVGSSNVAYADQVSEGEWEAVVVDAEAGKEVARVAFGDEYAFISGDVTAQLSDDIVYLGATDPDNGDMLQLAIDWRAGKVVPADSLTRERVWHIAAGRAAIEPAFGEDGAVRDIATGRDLVTIPAPADGGFVSAYLSLDGRYAFLEGSTPDKDYEGQWVSEDTGTIVDLDTGRRATVESDFSWTPDGNLLYLTRDEIKICGPLSGECDTEPLPTGVKPTVGS